MNAYIVQAVRTATGRQTGKLADCHRADMAGEVLDALLERSGIDPAAIEDVIMGCVSQIGERSFHIGRNAVLASKWPDTVPAVSRDRQFTGARMLAEKYHLTRDELDAFALRSYQRAAAATRSGAFSSEIVPLTLSSDGLHTVDAHTARTPQTLRAAGHVRGRRAGKCNYCRGALRQ